MASATSAADPGLGASRQPRPSAVVETGAAALALLDARWDALLSAQPLPNPTLSATWLREVARWETGLPLVVVVEADGAYLAGAALELRHGGRLSPRVATWLGPVEQLFSPDMLVRPGREDAIETVLAGVFEAADVLSISTQSAGVAARGLDAVAPWRRAAATGERWILPWPAPRLAYARKRAAYELRRAERQGARVEVRVAAAPDEVEAALVRLFRLHRDRWRDRPEETPRFATSAAHRAWNRRTVAALAERGSVRIAEVLEDGRTVAGSLGFVHGRGGVGHTQALRVGGVLNDAGHAVTLACLEALAEAGASVIDLGVSSGEAGGPKARLGPDPDPIQELFAAGARARQRSYEALRGARAAARRARRAPVRWAR